ncbi:MAG: 2-alkenal reductase [Chloroflexota bacterium]|nr:MAG: 2-alkenal reductase [Chloroflexota bacterium]
MQNKKNLSRVFIVFGFLLVTLFAATLGGIVGAYVTKSQLSLPENTVSVTSISPTSSPVPSFQVSTTEYTTAIVQAAEKAGPSVVTVLGTVPGQITFFGRTGDQTVSGSGVIITQDGYVLTNNHVIEDTLEVSIILADGTQIPAEVIGTDKFADLAVLKAADDVPPPIILGNSDALKRGETVIAIGSPLGDFKNTVTVGVISAMERRLTVSNNYQMEDLIQTDAAINQGNSGGPLLNLAGEVIGINTIIVRGGGTTVAEGLGFAIPSNLAKMVAEQIIAKGYFARPYLGINWEWITPRLSHAYNLPVEWGAYISKIGANTPASKAGLREGDIITQFGEQLLNGEKPFINVLYDYSPGETVKLTVWREGETIEVEVTLGESPQP